MIGVPLSGGKTLNVTFRSLNTRGDIFKTYNNQQQAARPESPRRSRMQGAQRDASAQTPPSTSQKSTRMGLVTGPVAQYTVNNKVVVTQQERPECEGPVDMPRQADLTKAVQLGVMRGLSSAKQKRKSSRTMTTAEKTYMQIKMRNDGVVPFQNTSRGAYQGENQAQFVKPLYLTGVSNFQTGPHPMKSIGSTSSGTTKQPRRGDFGTTQAATSTNDPNNASGNQQNVSQMGSQTSTDKFVDGGTKNTQTNHSIIETFELTNMIGGASIEAPIEIGPDGRARNLDSVEMRPTTQKNERGKVVGSHKPNSKMEEANSSIDQPSFQTEHEATFLWNNAKINQNSLSNQSRLNYGARSPTDNRKSHDRNSFQLESMMGQKPSHNMSLDSPRKHMRGGKERNERILSLQADKNQHDDITENVKFALKMGQSLNDQTMANQCATSQSPPLQELADQDRAINNQAILQAAKHRATQNYKKIDMIQLSGSMNTDQNGTKQSSRRQISARESIQERIKQATMNLPSPRGNQLCLGPVQGHSMQLVKTSERISRGGTSASFNPKVTLPSATVEQYESVQVHEYGAMILTQGASRAGQNASEHASQNNGSTTPRMTRISVDELQTKSPTAQKGLTKTETQVGGNLETIQAHRSDVEKGGTLTSDHFTQDGSMLPRTDRSFERTAKLQQSTVQVRQDNSSPLVVEGHATSKQGGVKIGRHVPTSRPHSDESMHQGVEPQTAMKVVSDDTPTTPLLEQTEAMPAIACSITATETRNAADLNINLNDRQPTSDLEHQATLSNNETQNLTPHSIDDKLEPKDGGQDFTTTHNKPVPTQLLILKSENGMGVQTRATTKVAAAASQTSHPSFELHSIGLRTMKSTENAGSMSGSPDCGRPETDLDGNLFNEENITNMALQSQIGTLTLTFPNSQESHTIHYKKLMSPQQKNLLEGRPMIGSSQKRGKNTMQIKPDLNNVNLQDLDDGVIRNMHAIGVNFATMQTNKLKPFESRATKKRKWRDYFETERASLVNTNSTTANEDIFDYDGSSSNADKIKILQRRLTAWPTFEQTSGFGSEPNQVVGTSISHAIDQASYMNTTDYPFKPGTRGTDQTLDTLPFDIRNIKTPGGVKSAVGCSRVVARIHLKKLIEKSHVDTLTQQQQVMVDPSIRERALQTQGCQRTTNYRIDHSNQFKTLDSHVAQHLQGMEGGKRSSVSPPKDESREQLSRSFKVHGARTARHNSMVSTIQTKQTNQHSQDLMSSGARGNPGNLGQARQSDYSNEEQSPEQVDRPKLQSFSLQNQCKQYFPLELRRRTDQQSNYLSRTLGNRNNQPIGVEDQKSANFSGIDRPQRSVDIVDMLKNTRVKQRVKQQKTRNIRNHSIVNDDSIRASQFSIQQQQSLDQGSFTITQKSHVGHQRGVNFETQKFEHVPKTASVSHRMKGFCCKVPGNAQGRAHYQNSLTQRPGLSPKAPVMRHGVFGPSHGASVHSKQGLSAGRSETKAKTQIRQFTRPMMGDATKCQVTLHESLNSALRKNQRGARKVQIQEEELVKNRVNRADLRHLHNYNTFRERVQSLHVPKLLSQFQQKPIQSPISNGQMQTQLQMALNDPERVNAYAVLYFKRDQMPGTLNGRKLHTSQLSNTPEMHLDIMVPPGQS